MKKSLFLGLALIIIALAQVLTSCAERPQSPLLVYCAAGVKHPMDEIAQRFEKERRQKVILAYGGSGVLLTKIETQKVGDLFVASSTFHMNIAQNKGFIAGSKPVVLNEPVILVGPGNPKKVSSLASFTDPRVRVSLADGNAAAIGKLAEDMLRAAGIYEQVRKKAVTVSRMTVEEVALDVILGEADATIVWRPTAERYARQGKAGIVEIDKGHLVVETVTIGLLTFSASRELAEEFIACVKSSGNIWTKYGYKVLE
ncbi:MAG: molybdate ABC transporter substrate-binding protein [bacterium]|nr:molybdate ABC transporter substrate-binding protein [bacterium]